MQLATNLGLHVAPSVLSVTLLPCADWGSFYVLAQNYPKLVVLTHVLVLSLLQRELASGWFTESNGAACRVRTEVKMHWGIWRV